MARPSQSKAPEPVGAAFSSVWDTGATSISHLTEASGFRPRARAPGFTSAVGRRGDGEGCRRAAVFSSSRDWGQCGVRGLAGSSGFMDHGLGSRGGTGLGA